jgi:HEAT repeat protein
VLDSFASSEAIVQAALLSGQFALLATAVLLGYAFVLRASLTLRNRRYAAFIEVWRPVLAEVVSDGGLQRETLPALRRRDLEFFLHEWNITHDSIRGSAESRLNALARELGIDHKVWKMLDRHQVRHKLVATATLGHLGEVRAWDRLCSLVESSNTLLSLLAASALVQIDANRALPIVIPRMAEREDWPPARVATILRRAGPDAVSEPLAAAILEATPEKANRLLGYLDTCHLRVADELTHRLLKYSDDDYIITALLRTLDNPRELPIVRKLLGHERWHIRMLSAIALGRIGEAEDTGSLIELLSDQAWWVRYRAAQTLAHLPFMTIGQLREVQAAQGDRYARDILDQVIAEEAL